MKIEDQLAANDQSYAARFCALAQAEPHGLVTSDALYKTLELQEFRVGRLTPMGQQALQWLHREYMTSPKMGKYLQQLARNPWPGVEPLLRDVLARNPDRTAQGQACLGLAAKFGSQARVPKLMNDPVMAEKLRESCEPEQIDAYLRQDVTATLAEATTLFQRVVHEFADVSLFPAYAQDDPWPSRQSLAGESGRSGHRQGGP